MSKKSNWLKSNFGKYWLFQIIIIGTLITYSLIATVSIIVLANNNFGQQNPSNDNTVVISIIFESKDNSSPITWNSIVTETATNTSLYSIMSSNFQLNTSFNSIYGYLINGINSLIGKNPNFWTYYYYMKGSGWTFATTGVSYFYLTHDFQIKWIYGPASV